MQGTNLLSYYLCDFVLYFNAIYSFFIIVFDLVTTRYILWTSVFLLAVGIIALLIECSGSLCARY